MKARVPTAALIARDEATRKRATLNGSTLNGSTLKGATLKGATSRARLVAPLRRLGLALPLAMLPLALLSLAIWGAPVGAVPPPLPESTVEKPGAEAPARASGQYMAKRVSTTHQAADHPAAEPTRPAPDAPPPHLPPPYLPHGHHPWARFQPGAWRTLEVVSETFDAQGGSLGRSATLLTESLRGVVDDHFTVETASTVEIGGKRLVAPPRVVTRHVLTDSPGDLVGSARVGDEVLLIDGERVACQKWELVIGAGPARRRETVWHSAERSPYVMRRELSMADSTAATDISHQTLEVVRLDVPVSLGPQLVAGAEVRVTTRSGPNTETRLEVWCDAAPGGVVEARAIERDASGRRVRWSTTQLEDHGVSGPPRRVRQGPFSIFRRRG